MGVAPHVKAEFWLFEPMAFCSDLKNWTTTILTDAQAPLVHSVSYGTTESTPLSHMAHHTLSDCANPYTLHPTTRLSHAHEFNQVAGCVW